MCATPRPRAVAVVPVRAALVRLADEREGGLDLAKHARLVAGHSLGEYTALAAAGAEIAVEITAVPATAAARPAQDTLPEEVMW